MTITLEEARTLDNFAKSGSIARTAETLKKASSAVVYALASIERKTGLKLLDRSGYRTRILPAGQAVLEGCRRMLSAEADLAQLCRELSGGWEADLKIIVEGVVPLDPVIRGLKQLSNMGIPTRFHVFAEFLAAVETTFLDSGADLMISVLPPQRTALEAVRLAPIPADLVAHKEHPLVKARRKVTTDALRRHPMLTVRGSDPRLNMSTAAFETESTLQLNDFHSKKIALIRGLGYGWMPRYLIEDELKSGKLRIISWSKPSVHVFHPYLYHRGEKRLGKAGALFVKWLRSLPVASRAPIQRQIQ